ncbi:hypothetical protein ABZ920_15410 [Streptomyces sp. NPDC046831]|uniref:hypothetical protein n=1 Tax=Streptomyces sp. NPDC046831 TaxID=3154805 RepID=UPI0033D3F68B
MAIKNSLAEGRFQSHTGQASCPTQERIGAISRLSESVTRVMHILDGADLGADYTVAQLLREILDYAFQAIPGWREINDGTLTVAEFRENYLHSAAAGLHVIANTIAAARMAGVPPRAAVDALTEIPWRRDALKTVGEDEMMAHEFFEGTLAKTTWDLRGLRWRAGASGATARITRPPSATSSSTLPRTTPSSRQWRRTRPSPSSA